MKMLFNGNHEFLMEVTEKSKADVKGGTLIDYDSRLRLLEEAQVPKEHKEDFQSVQTFDFLPHNGCRPKKLRRFKRRTKRLVLNY